MSDKVVALLKPALPLLRYLPRPVLTLPPILALHLASHPSPGLSSFFHDPLTSPLHLPILSTIALIPVIYVLGLISGNVSWVDRIWPIYPVLCSCMVVGWGWVNESGGVYSHNLPRLSVMLFLQFVWAIRLIRHAIRRNFYDIKGEDYRYTAFRKLVPGWFFQLIHLVVIAIAQPILLFALCLPFHAVLTLPPSELSAGPVAKASIPFSAVAAILPKHHHAALADTPVLNLMDLVWLALGLTLVFIEYKADNAMYAYQTAKHASKSKDLVHPPKTGIDNPKLPQPTPYPRSHAPGFPTFGMWKWVRHPNFAAEQLFWVNQALFVVGAGNSSGVTRSAWVGSSVFGPSFALSVLFCASTFLTEWITGRKYPAYASYKKLVGQFLPQETVFRQLLAFVTGSRAAAKQEIYP